MKHFKRLIAVLLVTVICAGLTPAYAATTSFSDIPSNAWYAGDVADVQRYGILNGVGNNKFNPKGNMTLAQAITMAARTYAYSHNETIPDTGSSPWYQMYVQYASEKGIFTAGEFGPDYTVACSRLNMAKLFARVVTQEKTLNNVTALPDVENNSANASVFYLYNQGILTGSDAYGTFKPYSQITRSEAAAILNRVLDTSKRKTVSLTPSPPSTPSSSSGPETLSASYKAALQQAHDYFAEDLEWAADFDNDYGDLTYALYDIDGNGTKELLVSFSEYEGCIFAIYTDTGDNADCIVMGTINANPSYSDYWAIEKNSVIAHFVISTTDSICVDYYRFSENFANFLESLAVDNGTPLHSKTTPAATAYDYSEFLPIDQGTLTAIMEKYPDIDDFPTFYSWK